MGGIPRTPAEAANLDAFDIFTYDANKDDDNFRADILAGQGEFEKYGFIPHGWYVKTDMGATDEKKLKDADSTQQAAPLARTKRTAEGPVFYGPNLRELHPTEKIPMIDVICNGPGWKGGHKCDGLFADGDGTEAFMINRQMGKQSVMPAMPKLPTPWPTKNRSTIL